MARSVTVESAFQRVLVARAIRCVYQPIVRLADAAVVAFEALARGPANTRWEQPDALVRDAALTGRLAELDWICRAAAIKGALSVGLPRDLPLFVNVEPVSSRTTCPPDLWPVIDRGLNRLLLVAEVTERAVAADPAALLTTVNELRLDYGGLALDDVGADPASQALMPLLNPDVIKLDRGIIQARSSSHARQVIGATRRQADRTGALILAEGVETATDLAAARDAGAVFGQGWHWGCPERLPRLFPSTRIDLPKLAAPVAHSASPFETAGRYLPGTRVHRDSVATARHSVEVHAAQVPEPKTLLATFPNGEEPAGTAADHYAGMGAHAVITGLFGPALPTSVDVRRRVWTIQTTDFLAMEWNMLSIAAGSMAAVFARPAAGQAGTDWYDMIATTDPSVIISAALPMLKRLDWPHAQPNPISPRWS